MQMKFYKYHGAGNDFLIADGRSADIELTAGQIAALCDRHTGFGADGVMVLENSAGRDFAMRYYNSDGSGGMMCGNGGRCIVAFAADLGYGHFEFEAPDGTHCAEILETSGKPFSSVPRTVRLKMKDVSGAVAYPRENGVPDWFIDTGTRHLVRFVPDPETCDVAGDGGKLRRDPRFAPAGVNVNFVKINESAAGGNADISVRTYEKGVEDETLACGTGIVASALVTWLAAGRADLSGKRTGCRVHARIADLSVSFVPALGPKGEFNASEIYLTGPAAFIGTVCADL